MDVFTTVAGVPVHYDRFAPETGFGYGTRGRPFRPRGSPKLITLLDAAFTELFALSPFGTAEVVTSAGAFVDKPGQHGKGAAFDLDGIFWNSASLIANEYPGKTLLYLAVESILRKHFGTVLAYNYNAAHKDHFHCDHGSSVGFNSMSKSRVEYLQACITFVYGNPIEIDGVWGPQTAHAVTELRNQGAFEGTLRRKQTWLAFLTTTATSAFATAHHEMEATEG